MASAAEQLAANMNFGAFQKATELHKRIWFTIIARRVKPIRLCSSVAFWKAPKFMFAASCSAAEAI